MSKKKAPVPREAYELRVEVDGEVKLDKAVEVRRASELNAIANNYTPEIGQTLTWTATRVF